MAWNKRWDSTVPNSITCISFFCPSFYYFVLIITIFSYLLNLLLNSFINYYLLKLLINGLNLLLQ